MQASQGSRFGRITNSLKYFQNDQLGHIKMVDLGIYLVDITRELHERDLIVR